MAMTSNAPSPNAPGAPASANRGEPAPAWIFVLFVAGMLLVFLGQRVLLGFERLAPALSGLGLLAVLASTLLRFAPRFSTTGERRRIERQLAVLSGLGLLGLAVYFATSDAGAAKLGLDKLTTDQRTRFEELARVVWISLIAISVVPMVFAETALLPMRRAEHPESRRVRSATAAGLVLALAAVYGSLFVYFANGIDLKVDYSYFKTSQPSESTRKVARSLTGDPIRVVAFFPEVNEVRREVETYLKQAAAGASNLKVEVRDRLLVPKLAQELRAMQDGVIVLSRGTTTQTMQIGTDLEQARNKLKTLDRDFQEQLLKIAKSRRTAYVTVGHGELADSSRSKPDSAERSGQIVRTLLQRQNYLVRDLGLGQGLGRDVPDDAEVVLILGPTTPFLAEELASLRRYAERGGRLLLALEPEAIGEQELVRGEGSGLAAPPSPAPSAAVGGKAAASNGAVADSASAADAGFNGELAALAGLKFAPDLIANERQHLAVRHNDSDRTRLASNTFSSHASVSTLSRNAPRSAIVVFGAGSLEKGGGSERVDFAVKSPTGSFQDGNHNFKLDAPAEKSVSFNFAAAVTRALANPPAASDAKKDDKKNKPEPKDFKAMVFADADAFSDFVMGEVIGNQILLVDAMRWLVGEESISQGLPNTEEDVRIDHTKQADSSWFYGTILGIPGLVLASGLLLSNRRSRGRGGKK
ncbi:MAG TPA: Gldg family protein [Polyangiaceae bacterium]|nr:Gldg family protein [Polyangiaceae bacterium]